MDIAAILGSVRMGVGVATDTVGLLHSLRSTSRDGAKDLDAAIQRVTTLQKALLEAQDGISALKDRCTEQADQVKALEQRLAERDAHILHDTGKMAFVYVRKESADHDTKNGPWFCQPCFDQGKKAVLQFAQREFHFDRYKCPLCGSEIRVPNDNKPECLIAPVIRSHRFDSF